jgi:hypothetical protein
MSYPDQQENDRFVGPATFWRPFADTAAAGAAGDLKRGGRYPRGVRFTGGGTLEVTHFDDDGVTVITDTIPDGGVTETLACGEIITVTGGEATNFILLW